MKYALYILLLYSFVSASAQKPTVLGIVQAKKISEASGLAASTALPGHYWTHNDSGGQPEVYLLSSKAKLVSTITLKGALNRDWEDIAESIGPIPHTQYVYVGDIGNNVKLGVDIQVYRFEAPTKKPDDKATVKPDKLFLRYPDGPRDAETLMIDPIGKYIYIISKREAKVGIYRTPLYFKDNAEVMLEKVATIPYTWVTAGDISQDGLHIIIRDKKHIYYWRRKPGESIETAMSRPSATLPYKPEPQGEGLTFSMGNTGYLTISEGEHPPLYFYSWQFK